MDKKRITRHIIDATPESRHSGSLFLAGFAIGMFVATMLAVWL